MTEPARLIMQAASFDRFYASGLAGEGIAACAPNTVATAASDRAQTRRSTIYGRRGL